jgi:hypothetical protein
VYQRRNERKEKPKGILLLSWIGGQWSVAEVRLERQEKMGHE